MHTTTTEAIILAGGLGTRLRSAVPDLPKCMAPVAGRPFLAYVIDSLRREGIRRFIFSLGYRAEDITAFLASEFKTLDYTIVIEEEPLGTGGAIALCLPQVKGATVLIANGDTLFRIDILAMEAVHEATGAECTLALKPMRDFDRYGVVTLSENGSVTGFQEKRGYSEGLINGGLYLLGKHQFSARPFPERFSFEKDFLEPVATAGALSGCIQEGYFIDIGIPEDFHNAQADLQLPPLDLSAPDKSWTLFLDRDGVINEEHVGTYILHWGEFRFSEGVLDAMRILGERFGRIIIVTNQRGVGRGLMSAADLERIHTEMVRAIEDAGGRVDAVYFCTDTDPTSFNRKPNPGMAFQAASHFPEIDLSRAIMVGNKPSDARFGRAAGMHTVFVTTTNPGQPYPHPDIDLLLPSLPAFARALQS
ncbi:MAG: histidinol phosphate phosphatase [Flaviaesturariibacter sp.]|nr:histidinol phosphate phosphatase [Flaviaesturariibacter sp.]